MIRTDKQKRLLQLLLNFNYACKENEINYSLACGSCLGAVRENGFIPWDEDIDIMMRITDYKKMEAICHKYKHSFFWVSATTSELSPVIYARVYECELDYDRMEEFPYIDIHVYVGGGDDDSKIRFLIQKADFLSKLYWIKKRKYHHIFSRKKSLIGFILQIPLLIIPSNLILHSFMKFEKKFDYQTSNIIYPLQGYYKLKEVFSKEILDNYIFVDFEGERIPVIKNYDEYLTRIYGDYMTPVKYNH